MRVKPAVRLSFKLQLLCVGRLTPFVALSSRSQLRRPPPREGATAPARSFLPPCSSSEQLSSGCGKEDVSDARLYNSSLELLFECLHDWL